jgi:multiple sugar transport system substrate-binding protein
VTINNQKKGESLMYKKLTILFTLLLVLTLVLTACKPAGPTGSTEEKVTLRFWSMDNVAFNAGYDALIKSYMDAHPNVTITRESFNYDLYIQTLQTAMPAKEEADILQIFGTWTPQYYERLASVPDSVMLLGDAQKLWYAAPLGGFTINGKMYGLPQEFNCEYGGVLVNKTMFEAAGLTYPPQWKTMDDVVADGVKLSKSDESGMMSVSGFDFVASDPLGFAFLAGIKQRGGDYWNADRTGFTFDTPEAKAQLTWMVDAVNQGIIDPVVFNNDSNWVGSAFFTNKVGIGYIGTWQIAEGLANYPDFKDEWDYFFLPSVQGDPKFVADSGWGMSVSPNSKYQDIAWDFAKFVTADPKNAIIWNIASGTIPAIPEVAKSEEIAAKMPWVAKALAILPYGEYLGVMPDRDLIMYEILYPRLLEALQGVKTIDETLQTINTETNSTFK